MQSKGGCLLCSIALWDGSLEKYKVRGVVPCCGQNGHGAQVPQHTIYHTDTYHISKYRVGYFKNSAATVTATLCSWIERGYTDGGNAIFERLL